MHILSMNIVMYAGWFGDYTTLIVTRATKVQLHEITKHLRYVDRSFKTRDSDLRLTA